MPGLSRHHAQMTAPVFRSLLQLFAEWKISVTEAKTIDAEKYHLRLSS